MNEGTLSLSGTVKAVWQKLKAEDIMAAFTRNVHIDAQEVSLKVENQIVFMSGRVPNWKAYYAARDIAVYTRGVLDVQNNLWVH